MGAAGVGLAATAFSATSPAKPGGTTILVAHGAWSAKAGDGWRVPASPPPPDTSAEDLKWIQAHRLPHPLKCFETPVKLRNGDTKIPCAYIYAKRATPADTFRVFAERAKKEHWDYREIDASHSAHVTAPDALASLLGSIIEKRSA